MVKKVVRVFNDNLINLAYRLRFVNEIVLTRAARNVLHDEQDMPTLPEQR